MFTGRADAEAETPILWPPHAELTHWKRPWCWERLGAGGEGDDRGRDGWMASPTRCTWIWVNSRSWWWTGRPGVLWLMGLQRVRHNWATELDWTDAKKKKQNLNLYLKLYLKMNSKCILDICVRCENRILQVSVLPCFLAGEMIWNSGVCLLLTEAIRQFCGFRSLLIHTLRYP